MIKFLYKIKALLGFKVFKVVIVYSTHLERISLKQVHKEIENFKLMFRTDNILLVSNETNHIQIEYF